MDKRTDREVKRVLARLGLSDNEQCVYLHLLERGPGVVAVLGERCHMYRPMIYRVLKKLTSFELVYEVPHGKRTLYAAREPKQLLDAVARLAHDLTNVMPALEELYRSRHAHE